VVALQVTKTPDNMGVRLRAPEGTSAWPYGQLECDLKVVRDADGVVMPANFTEGLEADDEDAPAEAAYTQQLTEAEMNLLQQLLSKLGIPADTPEADILAAADAALAPAASEAETALTTAGFTVAQVPTLVKPEAFAEVQAQLALFDLKSAMKPEPHMVILEDWGDGIPPRGPRGWKVYPPTIKP
jgi:hypothetical protein